MYIHTLTVVNDNFRFGWFDIEAESVSKPVLNYCGAGLCLLR